MQSITDEIFVPCRRHRYSSVCNVNVNISVLLQFDSKNVVPANLRNETTRTKCYEWWCLSVVIGRVHSLISIWPTIWQRRTTHKAAPEPATTTSPLSVHRSLSLLLYTYNCICICQLVEYQHDSETTNSDTEDGYKGWPIKFGNRYIPTIEFGSQRVPFSFVFRRLFVVPRIIQWSILDSSVCY